MLNGKGRMSDREEVSYALFAGIFMEIMSRVKTPEDLVKAYADLKQLESQIGAGKRGSKEQELKDGEGSPLQPYPDVPRDDQGEPVRVIKLNDRVILRAGGQEVVAEVIVASENGRSLMLSFDATIFGIRGKMGVLQEDGKWISVFGRHPVEVEWRPKRP